MNVVFFGTAPFAVPSLEALAACQKHSAVLCCTQPDKPKGRGRHLQPTAVKQTAQKLNIPVITPGKLTPELFASYKADVGVLAAYGKIIRQPILDCFPQGILGIHPSLLPAYRGAAPAAYALLNGETSTGMTIYRLDAGLDSGPILTQQPCAIDAQENSAELTARLAVIGAAQLIETLDALEADHLTPTAQDESKASYAHKLSKEQSRINWSQPAHVILNQVRALSPWPGTTVQLEDETIKVHEVRVVEQQISAQPGCVVPSPAKRLFVATADHPLELLSVQPSGKRAMTTEAFLAGHPISVGTCFS